MLDFNLNLTAEPIVKALTSSGTDGCSGSELQRAILRGFGNEKELPFEKTFTLQEHGEFFRGALTMAGLRYTGDFYEFLQRYGTVKVTITKTKKEK